jgi:hypothetical protein
MALAPKVQKSHGIVGDITVHSAVEDLIVSAHGAGITAERMASEVDLFSRYIGDLDRLWIWARADEQTNPESQCRKEIHTIAHFLGELHKALNKVSDTSRGRVDWAMRQGASTVPGFRDLNDVVFHAEIYIGELDRKCQDEGRAEAEADRADSETKRVARTTRGPLLVHICRRLMAIYEVYSGLGFGLGERKSIDPDGNDAEFHFETTSAVWLAQTIRLIFPDIDPSEINTAAKRALALHRRADATHK